MYNSPSPENPFGGAGPLVDRRLGNAYRTVKEVHESLAQILYVAANLQNLTPKDIELQESADQSFLQWRYVGAADWTNLLPLIDIPQAEFQVSGNWLQWQYRGAATWTNLLNMTDFFNGLTATVSTAGAVPRADANGHLDPNWMSFSGPTADRPTSFPPNIPWFDTDLGFPIWLKPVTPPVWVNAVGAPV